MAEAGAEQNKTPTPKDIVFDEIRRLRLESNVLELEEHGYTVVENAISRDMVERMRQVIIDQTAEKSGITPSDLDDTYDGGRLREGCYLLFEDPVFEKLVMNEITLALMQYLLGHSLVLSTVYSHVRVKGDPALTIHTDQWGLALTNPVSVATANYALEDYKRDHGSYAVVPGSNHLLRRPAAIPHENDVYQNPNCIPLEIPAGSLIVTAGNTWHGAYARKIPGVRLNTAVVYCRNWIQTQERIREGVTQEMLDRNPPRFADVVGVNNFLGFGREGPDLSKAAGMGNADRF